MYHVISEQTPRGPIYLVEDTITKSRKRGSFDCERSAQAFADYLNEREGNETANIRVDTSHGEVAKD